MLQELYDNLQRAGAAHQLAGQHHSRPRRRPSGLTIVDHIETPSSASGRGGTVGGSSSGWWSGLKSMMRGSDDEEDGGGGASGPAVQGLYMYGGVGCGKTMLMDLFVDTAPPHFKVLRTHFHDFMLDVHSSLRKFSGDADPLLRVADGIGARARVLALDEFFVTDVADAMILARLFGRLWDRGLVLVGTSNRHPNDLYKGGLQRDLFLPFIARLKAACVSHDMASTTDYRKLAQHQRGLYFMTAKGASQADEHGTPDEQLRQRFLELGCPGAVPAPAHVEVMMGRSLEVPAAAGKACMFSFEDLCARPVAAADYLALTGAYHTLALRGIPVFNAANRSEAYRFVTLIDVMYENRTRLLCSAEAGPVDLFSNIITQFDAATDPVFAARPEVVVDDNLGFSKDRTISRLTEMQSLEYLLHHAKAHEPALLLALHEAQNAKQRKEGPAPGTGPVAAAVAAAATSSSSGGGPSAWAGHPNSHAHKHSKY